MRASVITITTSVNLESATLISSMFVYLMTCYVAYSVIYVWFIAFSLNKQHVCLCDVMLLIQYKTIALSAMLKV